MSEQLYNENVSEINGGMWLDTDPKDQPNGTRRFTLNAIDENSNETERIYNEGSTVVCDTFPDGFLPIGKAYVQDNTNFVILVNPITDKQDIGIIDSNSKYKSYINTSVLGLKITNQCDIKFRLRRNNTRVFYWVDALNKPRSVNLDTLENYYNADYKNYLNSSGDPLLYIGEKWNEQSFNLIKDYSLIPSFNNVSIVESGNILPGSYNFAIQLVDSNLNSTNWISTTNIIRIYNDSEVNAYQKIRGSKNTTNSFQSFTRASKSIKFNVSNLDTNFPYYRIGIIRATTLNGQVDKVLVSDLQSIYDGNFTYAGNDSELTETALGDILVDKEIIFAPQHIEQIENRLVLANTKGKQVNWCEYQKFASKIKTDLVTQNVILNDIQSPANVKAATSTFISRGYMPGEVYSFGIVYVFKDGTVSPTFHIPGKNITNTASLMKFHQLDSKYLDIHTCTSNNYWGVDADNLTLLGKNIRHHRFPYRKDVNKPLVTTTSTPATVTKYKLTLVISLNPAWTPGPITYPTVGGVSAIIPYKFSYQITGGGSTTSYSDTLVDTDVSTGNIITLYDGFTALSTISGSDYQLLDSTCQLATVYQLSGNNRFIITPTYTSYTLTSDVNSDEAEIFGIQFNNIILPNSDVTGFFIVRNERTDNDKIIIDNAVFGPMTQYQQYKSFGMIMPKNFYSYYNPWPPTSGIVPKDNNINFFTGGSWFFNPEFQFLGNVNEFDKVEVEGVYSETDVQLPTISNRNNSVWNDGGNRGVYINDVQAGTTYNSSINTAKNKDDDGFDLVVGYKNTNVQFTPNSSIIFPAKDRDIYLSAANHQDYDSNTYYNTSVDNKIGMYLTKGAFDTTLFNDPATNKNSLVYGSLVKNNTSSYSNFINSTYYKEHNNVILFNGNNIVNGVDIYNGDVDISAFNFVSSLYYDIVAASRPKKTSLWSIIVGVILVVAAVAVDIYSVGTASALVVSAVSSLAISLGVSLISSGIKLSILESMIQTDYELGLRQTVLDGTMWECLNVNYGLADDTIRWFVDRVSNIYIETSIPFGVRDGCTNGIPDFVDAPAKYDETVFRNYITNKLTTIDVNQHSGRLYKGYSSAEFYDINLDYMRFNKQKEFPYLPIEYDCCNNGITIYPNRIWNSEQAFQEELIDNYGVFLPNNYVDIEGQYGEITSLYRLGNNLFIHTKEGLWQLPQNNQERVTGEIVTFIGTGSLFSFLPRKVVDNDLGTGGTKHKWATVKTPLGVFFLSESERAIFIHGDGVKNISIKGLKSFSQANFKQFLSEQLYRVFNIVYNNTNNPANPDGTGYTSIYDKKYERVLITKRDFLITKEKINNLIISNTQPLPTSIGFMYDINTGIFYNNGEKLVFENGDFFENKSFTLSYSLLKGGKWSSFHSYIPLFYVSTQTDIYSYIQPNYSNQLLENYIWKHNSLTSFNIFYNSICAYIIEYVKKTKGVQDTITEDISFYTEARRWDDINSDFFDVRDVTFNKIILYNSRQSTGEVIIVPKNVYDTPQNFLYNQITNQTNVLLLSRRSRNWNLNGFRDYVDNYTMSMFSKLWNDVRNNYFIDKVVNTSVVNVNKNWYELESFKDKYLVVRLKFDTFSNINLIADFSVFTDHQDINNP